MCLVFEGEEDEMDEIEKYMFILHIWLRGEDDHISPSHKIQVEIMGV